MGFDSNQRSASDRDLLTYIFSPQCDFGTGQCQCKDCTYDYPEEDTVEEDPIDTMVSGGASRVERASTTLLFLALKSFL